MSLHLHMGVSKNRGTPKWMIYTGNPYEIGWFGGTTIFVNTHICNYSRAPPSRVSCFQKKSYPRIATPVATAIPHIPPFFLSLRIMGPSKKGGGWLSITGFWDLQTTSFEIPSFLGMNNSLNHCIPRFVPDGADYVTGFKFTENPHNKGMTLGMFRLIWEDGISYVSIPTSSQWPWSSKYIEDIEVT